MNLTAIPPLRLIVGGLMPSRCHWVQRDLPAQQHTGAAIRAAAKQLSLSHPLSVMRQTSLTGPSAFEGRPHLAGGLSSLPKMTHKRHFGSCSLASGSRVPFVATPGAEHMLKTRRTGPL